ncbi:hypothetical protein AVEN_129469-1 [Araneus ventricosus]|uniref:Uncharacterized protein n=1 Tax=Araneus ventricosus TaxID=182803 RepID=A0A4Y2M7C4_ARAVE|nr:hypothetical protein AVEN_129469-1 [Araneus ventricosus]
MGIQTFINPVNQLAFWDSLVASLPGKQQPFQVLTEATMFDWNQHAKKKIMLDVVGDLSGIADSSNASSACGEENRRIACSLNSLLMPRDCFQYASKTRRPKCLLPYKISPSELVFGKLPSFRSIPSLHRHLRMRMEYGEQVGYYTDRQTVSPLTDLAQNFIRTYIHDDKTVYQILSIWLFKFLSYSVRMTSNIQTDRLPVDGFCPKVDRNLQIMFKDHIPNFIPIALIVF